MACFPSLCCAAIRRLAGLRSPKPTRGLQCPRPLSFKDRQGFHNDNKLLKWCHPGFCHFGAAIGKGINVSNVGPSTDPFSWTSRSMLTAEAGNLHPSEGASGPMPSGSVLGIGVRRRHAPRCPFERGVRRRHAQRCQSKGGSALGHSMASFSAGSAEAKG